MRATSLAAFNKALPERESKRGRVYQHIVDKQEYGATDQELQTVLNMPGDTLRPTRLSLLKDGLIYDSGKTRQNHNGNECIVWVSSTVEQIGFF
jgi:hypothetical protein